MRRQTASRFGVEPFDFLGLLKDQASACFSCGALLELRKYRVADLVALSVVLPDHVFRECPRQPKVADAHPALAIEKEVLRLQISVDDIAGVQIAERAQQVVKDDFDMAE